MKKLTHEKYTSDSFIFRSEKYRYGDLFGITYLSRFKIKAPAYEPAIMPQQTEKIHLYILGDSYLEGHLSKKNFSNIDSLIFTRWIDPALSYQLDTSKINVLIIQTAERTFMSKFADKQKLKYPFINNLSIKDEKQVNTLADIVFNKDIDDNLEFSLFDNPLFTYIKQIRADINYYLFNKIPPLVVMSPDKRYLFLSSTVDTSLISDETSSFKTITDDTLQIRINNCNHLISHYKKMGFDEVYLSVIPNPVTVVGFNKTPYNQLIPRLQKNIEKVFEPIDIYADFLKAKVPVYSYSDSHWMPIGLQMWINKVDTTLSNLVNKHP